jgi:hypothetical protein
MDRFTLGEFNDLLSVNQNPSVSLLMPTFEKGVETRQNSIRFKNLLQKAQQQMDELSYPKTAIALLDDARGLLEDSFFWRNQGRGLALFLAESLEAPRIFRLPIALPEQVVVSANFHLKPLLPMITEDAPFLMLTLSQEAARLYRCSRFSIEELEVPDMPKGLDDALQYDDPERQLQFHTKVETVKGKHIRGSIHFGTGGISDQEKERIQRYFRIVDNALRPVLNERKEPMIPVALDFLLPIYQMVNSYIHLVDKGISYNPQESDPGELRDRCWEEVMATFHRRELKQALAKYNDLKGTGRTAGRIETIVPAAVQGRVDRLIIVMDRIIWGRYDAETASVLVHHDQFTPGDRDLIDLAACETLHNSGRVLSASAGEMPDELPAAAVLRY